MPAAIAWLAKPALTIVRLTFFILHIEFPLLWIILQHPQIDALPDGRIPLNHGFQCIALNALVDFKFKALL
jgi:hypothetical protein